VYHMDTKIVPFFCNIGYNMIHACENKSYYIKGISNVYIKHSRIGTYIPHNII